MPEFRADSIIRWVKYTISSLQSFVNESVIPKLKCWEAARNAVSSLVKEVKASYFGFKVHRLSLKVLAPILALMAELKRMIPDAAMGLRQPPPPPLDFPELPRDGDFSDWASPFHLKFSGSRSERLQEFARALSEVVLRLQWLCEIEDDAQTLAYLATFFQNVGNSELAPSVYENLRTCADTKNPDIILVVVALGENASENQVFCQESVITLKSIAGFNIPCEIVVTEAELQALQLRMQQDDNRGKTIMIACSGHASSEGYLCLGNGVSPDEVALVLQEFDKYVLIVDTCYAKRVASQIRRKMNQHASGVILFSSERTSYTELNGKSRVDNSPQSFLMQSVFMLNVGVKDTTPQLYWREFGFMAQGCRPRMKGDFGEVDLGGVRLKFPHEDLVICLDSLFSAG